MQVYSNQIEDAVIEAVVTRADGTVENLGVVSTYRRPWWRTLLAKTTRRR